MFLITEGADPDFIAACGNPFEKPINMSHAMPVVKSQTHITKSTKNLQITSI